MALTDEQRSMLQLLLGGQSYDDIASLLGVGPDEVRSRAREALEEIGGADPDAQVALSDYILGKADPIGRADAVRHLQNDPEANALASSLVTQLRLLAPQADLPEIPAPRGGRPVPAPAPADPPARPPIATPPSRAPGSPSVPPQQPASTSGRAAFLSRIESRIGSAFRGAGSSLSRIGASKRNSQLAIGLGALSLLLVAGALAAFGAFGGGDESDCASIDTSQAEQAGVPTVKLEAAGEAADQDCAPSGQVTLSGAPQGQGQNQSPMFGLQINAVNLEPTASGDTYVLWAVGSDSEALPLGQQTVDSSGNLTGGVPLTAQGVLLLPAFETVRVARLTGAEGQRIQSALRKEGQRTAGVIQFAGNTVLEGPISELGLDQLIEQAQGQVGGGGSGRGQGGQGPAGQ